MTEFDKPIKTVGKSTTFDTGAHRDAKNGKGRMDLLPGDAIIELAKHFQKGAEHHGDRNWEKGIPLSSYLDSGLRHAFQAQMGYTDEPHAVAACWNFLCYIQTKIWIEQGVLPASLNDMPPSRLPKCIYTEKGPTDEGCENFDSSFFDEDSFWPAPEDTDTDPHPGYSSSAPKPNLMPCPQCGGNCGKNRKPGEVFECLKPARIRRFKLKDPDHNPPLLYVEFIGDQGYFVWKNSPRKKHRYPISDYITDQQYGWIEIDP